MIWLLIGYIWLCIHRPFEIWPWLAALHFERCYMAFTVVCWLMSRPTLPRGNRLHWYFAAFVLVMVASWITSPYASAGNDVVENYLKIAVFYVMLVTTARSEQDLRRLLVGYMAVMTLWMAHCLREYNNGLSTWAQGIRRLIPVGHSYDFNDFAGLIVCSLPFVWVLWRQWTSGRRRLLLIGYCGLAAYAVMLSGSRMGFIGVVLTALLACLASANRWKLLAIAPVIAVVIWGILPPDRRSRYLTLYDPESGTATGASASAGNYRLNGLQASIPMFEERPLLGYGPMGFIAMNRFMPHNLYGQLLAELGGAGAIAFALILWGVTRNFFEARRIAPYAPRGRLAADLVAAVGATYLILAIMSWGFNFLFWHVWLWFGGFQLVALQMLKTEAENDQEDAADFSEAWLEEPVHS
jgi:hypothetical protein